MSDTTDNMSWNSRLSLHQQESTQDKKSNVNSSSVNLQYQQEEGKYYDIVLVCSAKATGPRNTFMRFCDESKWEVYLPSREKIGGEEEFKSFKRGYHFSTYIVILITPCFEQDVWAVNQFQIALKKAIEERIQNVIPVIFNSTPVPFEMCAITGVNYDDEFFSHVMKRTIKTKFREMKQKRYEDSLVQLSKAPLEIKEEVSIAPVEIKDVPMELECHVDKMDGASSYREAFDCRMTESLPSKTSQRFLTSKQFQSLCMSLDIPSPALNDWRGLAEQMELTGTQISTLENKSANSRFSPSKEILDLYFQHNSKMDKYSSLRQLNDFFATMNFGRGIKITGEALETCSSD